MSDEVASHELAPGDLVRVKTTGEIGVVSNVTTAGHTAHVWCLEWVGRSPPALTRYECALEALVWLHHATAMPTALAPGDREVERLTDHINEQAGKRHWLNVCSTLADLQVLALSRLSDALKSPEHWRCAECGRPVAGHSPSDCQCGRFER